MKKIIKGTFKILAGVAAVVIVGGSIGLIMSRNMNEIHPTTTVTASTAPEPEPVVEQPAKVKAIPKGPFTVTPTVTARFEVN